MLPVEDVAQDWRTLLAVAGGAGVSWDNAECVLRLADKYDMQSLVLTICDELVRLSSLSPGHGHGLSTVPDSDAWVGRWLSAAERYQMRPLFDACMAFARDHVCELGESLTGMGGAARGLAGMGSAAAAVARGSREAGADGGARGGGGGVGASASAEQRQQSGEPPLSADVALQLLCDTAAQMRDLKELWHGVCSALTTEGLAYDVVQEKIRIQDFRAWRRLTPPMSSFSAGAPSVAGRLAGIAGSSGARRSQTLPLPGGDGGGRGGGSGLGVQHAAAGQQVDAEALAWWL